MSEYIIKDNSECYYDDDKEVSLSEIFGHIFNNFKLLVIITLVFTLIGVCYVLMLPKKYEVSAIVKIEEPYGADIVSKYGEKRITASQVLYEIFSRSNMEKAIANTSGDVVTYGDVVENLHYEGISGTSNYKIYISKASNTTYWAELISNMVNSVMSTDWSAEYVASADDVLVEIEERIADYEELLSLTSDKNVLDAVTTLKEEKRKVESYISSLPDSFTWVMEPQVGSQNTGTSKTLICIIFFLSGGVIGLVASLVVGFKDKRIYNSKKLKDSVDSRLTASVPLYKKGKEIDRKEFRYISAKLSLKKGDTLSIVSLSPNAGRNTFTQALKNETEAEVVNLGIIKDSPEIISSIKNSTYTLIILRAGIDTFPVLEKFIYDMTSIGVDKYGFVLNGVDKSDKDVTLYSDRTSYASHIWLLESWKSYYKKNM